LERQTSRTGSKSASCIVYEMVEEFIEATERLGSLLDD